MGGIMDRMDTSDDFGHNSGLVPKWEVKAVQIANDQNQPEWRSNSHGKI